MKIEEALVEKGFEKTERGSRESYRFGEDVLITKYKERENFNVKVFGEHLTIQLHIDDGKILNEFMELYETIKSECEKDWLHHIKGETFLTWMFVNEASHYTSKYDDVEKIHTNIHFNGTTLSFSFNADGRINEYGAYLFIQNGNGDSATFSIRIPKGDTPMKFEKRVKKQILTEIENISEKLNAIL